MNKTDQIRQSIEQSKQIRIEQIEACRLKSIGDAEKLKEMISDNDLETLKLLVNERDEARAVLKTASVGDYVHALIASHEATMRVLNFSHQWVQGVETGLNLFKIGNRQYSIKERPNGLKIIGYRTEKEG